MFLIVLCNLVGILLYIFSWFVFIIVIFIFVWIVWYRNIECIVLWIGLFFLNENEILERLLEICEYG